MSSRFRRTGRKSSTPFFPGAWPTTPAHDNPSETSMGHAECNEASGKTRRPVKQLNQSDNSAPPHLDHVVNFHKRISQSYAVFTRSRQSSNTATSASVAGSSNAQSPPTSPVLSESSTVPSEGIQTPEDYPMTFPQELTLLSHKNADNFNRPPNRPPRNPNRTISLRRPTADDVHSPAERRLSAIQLDAPLLNLSPKIHHINTSPHEAAFSQMSTNPYLASLNDTGISSSDADSPEAPSYSSSLSSLAFAETVQNHSTILPEFTITPPVGGGKTTRNGPTSSKSSSSFGHSTDSPVLPSEDGLSPVSAFRGHRYQSPTSHHLSPSSADMDAFGLAASSNVFSDSDSMLSIPTSFQSASIQGSNSADDTARGHATRQSSVSLSLSMELSSNEPGTSSTRVQELSDVGPPFCPPQRPDRRMRSGTIKGEVTVLPSSEKPKKGLAKAGKLLTMNKVKQFGTRLKKLFRSKPEPMDPGETVYGVTTTTNTVEYTSEHPIPRKDSPTRRFGTPHLPSRSRTSPLLKFAKRRSMPAGTVSMPDVSHPRPLRPTSFLAMDGRNLNSSRHLVAMPSVTGIMSRGDSQVKKRQYRHSTVYGGYQQLSKPVSKFDSFISSDRRRSRTQTAPPTSQNHSDGYSDPRRSSVASSIGGALRTTVVPRPPLPSIPVQTVFGPRHRRSASTSARDAWNAARPVPERDLNSPVDPIDVSIPNVPREDLQELVIQPSPEEVTPSEVDKPAVLELDPQDSNERLTSGSTTVSPGTSIDGGRTRSQTQSTVRPNEQSDAKAKRRSRGFSLSSAISKRALKARSFMAGRTNEPPLPTLPTQELPTHKVTASVSGISFDMVTATGQSIQSPGDGTTSGCAEYDPDIVLDRMSFAATPGPPSTVASSMDLSIRSDLSIGGPEITPQEVYFTAESGSSVTDEESSEEENEESREFTRALGLEFDAIVNRARNE